MSRMKARKTATIQPKCPGCGKVSYLPERLCVACEANPPPAVAAERKRVEAIMRRSTNRYARRSV